MSDFPANGDYVECPLCEGKGRMKCSELAARLADHDVEARLTACRQQLVKAQTSRPSADPASDFREEVLHGPVTHILWRRSPKE